MFLWWSLVSLIFMFLKVSHCSLCICIIIHLLQFLITGLREVIASLVCLARESEMYSLRDIFYGCAYCIPLVSSWEGILKIMS